MQETFEIAFDSPPGTNIAGIPINSLDLPSPYISYGLPFQESCAKHVRGGLSASRVYIIASGSLSRNTEKLDVLIYALGQENVVGVQRGMAPHSLWSEILGIVAEAKQKDVDCVVTLGAGSLTDAAKLVVFCLANDINTAAQLAQYAVGSNNPPSTINQPTIPLVTIPTSLSGGEYFSLAGGTEDSTQQKHGFLHSGMGVKLIILDPELCLSTPPFHWLSTGVRSMDHCIEALCSLSATPVSDEKAERGLRLLVPNLLECKEKDDDVQARHLCQMAVRNAMDNIRDGIPMGGSHAIGHQLGPLGVPHGITSCVMCPAVMKFNLKHGTSNPEIAKRQKNVCRIFWSEARVAKVLRAANLAEESSDLGDALDVIIRALGLPRTLTELDISVEIIPSLSENALADFWAPTNPVPLVTATQVQKILKAVV